VSGAQHGTDTPFHSVYPHTVPSVYPYHDDGGTPYNASKVTVENDARRPGRLRIDFRIDINSTSSVGRSVAAGTSLGQGNSIPGHLSMLLRRIRYSTVISGRATQRLAALCTRRGRYGVHTYRGIEPVPMSRRKPEARERERGSGQIGRGDRWMGIRAFCVRRCGGATGFRSGL
jgi:hypothetical protein